jgi:hypothetical protein
MKSTRFLLSFSQIILMMSFATMSFGCTHFPAERGTSTNNIKEERNVGNFSSLDVGGAFKVYLTQGNTEKLVVEADADEIKEIVTEVVGGELRIYTKSNWHGNFGEMAIYLTFKQLESIDFSGAVEVQSDSPLTFNDLDMDVSGAAEVTLDMTAAKLDAEFSGASELTFTGTCEKGYIEISGASELAAESMVFTNLVIELSGASEARVNATGELNIDASGASSVRYKGGARLTVDTSGASSVKEF